MKIRSISQNTSTLLSWDYTAPSVASWWHCFRVGWTLDRVRVPFMLRLLGWIPHHKSFCSLCMCVGCTAVYTIFVCMCVRNWYVNPLTKRATGYRRKHCRAAAPGSDPFFISIRENGFPVTTFPFFPATHFLCPNTTLVPGMPESVVFLMPFFLWRKGTTTRVEMQKGEDYTKIFDTQKPSRCAPRTRCCFHFPPWKRFHLVEGCDVAWFSRGPASILDRVIAEESVIGVDGLFSCAIRKVGEISLNIEHSVSFALSLIHSRTAPRTFLLHWWNFGSISPPCHPNS